MANVECEHTHKNNNALAISARDLAGLLGISLRQCWRLNAAGRLPKPVRLGGSVRWSAEEISAWLAAGAPDRKLWEMTHGKKTEQLQ